MILDKNLSGVKLLIMYTEPGKVQNSSAQELNQQDAFIVKEIKESVACFSNALGFSEIQWRKKTALTHLMLAVNLAHRGKTAYSTNLMRSMATLHLLARSNRKRTRPISSS